VKRLLVILVLSLSCAGVTIAYLMNLTSGPFADDFGWARMGRAAMECGWARVWYDSFGCFFFRPFNLALVVQSLAAESWAVAHGTAMVIHVLLAFAVGSLAMRVFPGQRSRWLGIAAACVFYVHQANTTAVLQIDTLSQCISDFFSVIALLAAVAYVSSGARWAIISGLAALLAMLGKEGGVSTPLVVIMTVLLLSGKAVRLRKTANVVLSQFMAGAVYLLWRLNVQNLVPVSDQDQARYSFHIGLAALRNLGQFVFVEAVPWNSASLVWNGRAYEWAIGIAIGAAVAVVAGLGWKRLIRREPGSKVLIVWLTAVFLIWCTPYIFLVRVSEQEVYRLSAIAALIMSFGCWAYLRFAGARMAVPALIVWCVWISVSGVAGIQKAVLLRHNAAVVSEMLEEAAVALGDVSTTERVWVFVTPSRPPTRHYSILYINESYLRWHALDGLDWYLKKPGLRIEHFLPGEEPPETSPEPPRLKKLRLDIIEGSAEPVP